MKYGHKVVVDGITYSCDMVRFTVAISEFRLKKFIDEFIDREEHMVAKCYFNSTTSSNYRHFVFCNYGDATLKIGFYYNDATWEHRDEGFIEFNPNKILDKKGFLEDWEKIKSYMSHVELKRFDLAIDLPVERNKVAMLKDNRTYRCVRKSVLNLTEYLGTRSKVGYVKLYNKTIESNLVEPLTRLEITCSAEHINIPTVYNLEKASIPKEPLIQVILISVNMTECLSVLTPYLRTKIVKAINVCRIDFDINAIEEIKKYCIELGKGGFVKCKTEI